MTITTALEAEMPILIPEKVLTRSDFTGVRPLLDKVRSTGGVLGLPLPPYYLFLPDFADDGH